MQITIEYWRKSDKEDCAASWTIEGDVVPRIGDSFTFRGRVKDRKFEAFAGDFNDSLDPSWKRICGKVTGVYWEAPTRDWSTGQGRPTMLVTVIVEPDKEL